MFNEPTQLPTEEVYSKYSTWVREIIPGDSKWIALGTMLVSIPRPDELILSAGFSDNSTRGDAWAKI